MASLLLKAILICFTSFVVPLFDVQGKSSRNSYHSAKNFPTPPYIRQQVRFWEAIFQTYPTHTTVIHDSYNPSIIIDVIDFKEFSTRYKNGVPYSRKERRNITKRYLKRYRSALHRFSKMGRKALSYGAMEKRVYTVYSKNKSTLRELLRGRAAIRSQGGLKDEFAIAAKRSESYLPYMERIFRQEGIPTDLTMMVFVESMFNLNARSKVGASGVWQFMPRTGRLYMTVNRLIDERNSPIKATTGAARLLKDNFRTLGTWPLAITAYNHGAGGLLKASRRFSTKNIDTIVRRHRSRTFGFASRNFYAEFIAAKNTYRKLYARNRNHHPNPLSIKKIRINHRQSVSSLLRNTSLTESILRKYNPDISNRAFKRRRHTLLPRGFEIFVPSTMAKKVSHSLAATQNRKSNRRRM